MGGRIFVLGLLAAALVLNGCRERETPQFKVDPEELMRFRPPDLRPFRPSPVFKESLLPVNPQQAAILKTPGDYQRTRLLQLAEGILFKQYERKGHYPPDPVQTLRVLLIKPRAFSKVHALFSDQFRKPLYFYTVAHRRKTLAVMNWGFFGAIPAGDILGQRCIQQGARCRPALYHNSERRTRKRTDLRYTLVINRQGRATLFRGGLGKQARQWYSLALGGGILLFDRDLAPPLWFATGRKNYSMFYAQPRYNDPGIVKAGQAGDPRRSAPRSALGIMADGSLLYLQIGEGRYRLIGGATPARLALLLKQMGAIKALMFDGGGAPVMVVRTQQGQTISRTLPEHTRTSNYYYNYSFLVVTH